MGKSILVVDNRKLRAQSLMGNLWVDYRNLHNVTCLDSMPEEDVVFRYDVICIHGSLIKSGQYDALLNKLVKERYVIIFTGDVSQIVFSNEGHLLKVPATAFYSPKLIPFCRHLDEDLIQVQLLTLVYGVEHWRLPLLFQLRQLLWQFPENERDYKKKMKIDELKSALEIADITTLDEQIANEIRAL